MSEQWKKVVSESEIGPGACIEVRNCNLCGLPHRTIVVRREEFPGLVGCRVCGAQTGWLLTSFRCYLFSRYHERSLFPACITHAIGKLWILVVPPEAEKVADRVLVSTGRER